MQKQSVWILWVGCLVAWFLVGGLVGTIGKYLFWLLVVVHAALDSPRGVLRSDASR